MRRRARNPRPQIRSATDRKTLQRQRDSRDQKDPWYVDKTLNDQEVKTLLAKDSGQAANGARSAAVSRIEDRAEPSVDPAHKTRKKQTKRMLVVHGHGSQCISTDRSAYSRISRPRPSHSRSRYDGVAGVNVNADASLREQSRAEQTLVPPTCAGSGYSILVWRRRARLHGLRDPRRAKKQAHGRVYRIASVLYRTAHNYCTCEPQR